MTADVIEQMSEALADRLAAATCVVAVARRPSPRQRHPVAAGRGGDLGATAGRAHRVHRRRRPATADARTTGGTRPRHQRRAWLRLAAATLGHRACRPPRRSRAPGSLALLLGAGACGAPTGRLAMVHATGAEWHSQAGGRIDALLRLDTRLGADEGGPVLTPGGKLLGMSTSGPRRRALVIPAATIARVLPAAGRRPRRPRLARRRPAAGRRAGELPRRGRVRQRHDGGQPGRRRPGRAAGVLPGDLVLEVDGTPRGPRPRPGGGAGAGADRSASLAAAAAGRRDAPGHRDDRRAPRQGMRYRDVEQDLVCSLTAASVSSCSLRPRTLRAAFAGALRPPDLRCARRVVRTQVGTTGRSP